MSFALSLLAAAVAAPVPPAAAAEAVDAVEVTTRAPVIGDLQQGVVNYRAEFFRQVRPSTAMDMVSWLPGFVFEDTRDVRGLGGASGNVLIDGKPPTSKTDTLQSVLRRIPASQVDRIDLVVGGAPGVDMQGRPVIANVILKPTATRRRVVQLQAFVDRKGRTTPAVLLSTAEKHGDRSLEASLEVYRNIAIFPGYGYGPWSRVDGTGAILVDGRTTLLFGGPWTVGSAAYEFPFASGRLKVNGQGRYGLTHLDERNDLAGPAGQSYLRGRQRYSQGEFGLRWERSFGRTLLQAQLLERLTDRRTNEVNARQPPTITFFETGRDEETVGRVTLRFKRDDRLTLESFAEVALNRTDTDSNGTIGGDARDVPSASVQVRERRGEAGVTASWKPNARYSLDAALKFEASHLISTGGAVVRREFAYPKPRAVLAYTPGKDSQLRLRAEREVGQVAFLNFATISEFNTGRFRSGNPNLRPLRTWIVEAVAERRFWTGGVANLTLRRRWLDDIVENLPLITNTETAVIVANIGDGRSTDLIANLTVPMKRLGLDGVIAKGVLTRNWAKVRDPVTGRLRPFSSQPYTQAELHLSEDLPRWKLNWGIDAFYRGRSKTYSPLGDDGLSPWPHANLFVERRLLTDFSLRLEVQNLPGAKVRQTSRVFTGLRDRSPLLYRDERRLSVGPLAFVRLRGTFD